MDFLKRIMVNLGLVKVEEDVDKFFLENELEENAIIQSLTFDSKVFATSTEAKEWSDSHFLKSSVIEEVESGFKLPQLDETEFKTDSLKEIEMRRGVRAKVGVLRPSEVEELFTLSLRSEDIKLNSGLPHIIELAKVVDGIHPRFGRVEITKETLLQFKKNFDNKSTGVELNIDFDHEMGTAAAWVKSVFLDIDGETLLGEVSWTPKGAQAVQDKEFRYFSPMFQFNFVHPHTGEEFGPTLTGGALTNFPFLKMDAITMGNKQSTEDEMEQIALSEHKTMLSEKDSEIAELKLSEEKAKGVIKGLNEENKTLSEKVEALEAEKAQTALEAKNEKLFSEGKINKVQLDALNAGKSAYEVLELSEKMNTEPKGKEGENKTIKLSERELELAKKFGHTPEEWEKFLKEEAE